MRVEVQISPALFGPKAGKLRQAYESESDRGEMMATVYTYSEARQNLAALLERTVREGEVRIKRRDGQIFVVRPASKSASPLEVEGVNLGITAAEIVQFIHEGRKV